MNIHRVAENLKNTIAGKEKHLELLKDDPSIVAKLLIQMLEVNIDELKRILADVESCQQKAIDDSWKINPDRMGQ